MMTTLTRNEEVAQIILEAWLRLNKKEEVEAKVNA